METTASSDSPRASVIGGGLRYAPMCSNAVRMTGYAKIERAAVLGCALLLLMPDSSQNDRAASPLWLN